MEGQSKTMTHEEQRDTPKGEVVQQERKRQPVDVGLLRASSPAEMVQMAEQIATPLADIIKRRELFVDIGGKKHVRVEGWTTMLAMLGVTPREEWCHRIETEVPHPDSGHKVETTMFEAKVELIRLSDGASVGGASAECGGPDERDWHFRTRKEFHYPDCPVQQGEACTCRPGFDRSKIGMVVGFDPVQPNARRSMALTRATSKAARNSFAWIVELAGFATTPAEEMTGAFAGSPDRTTPSDHETASTQQPRQPEPQQSSSDDQIRKMQSRFAGKQPCPLCGQKIDKGEWIAYRIDTKRAAHWRCYEEANVEDADYEDDLPQFDD